MHEPEQLPTRTIATMRTATGLTGLAPSSSEPQEYDSMEQMQERAASRRDILARAYTEANSKPPTLRVGQETELREPEQNDEDERVPKLLNQVQSRRASRVSTLLTEAAPSKPPSRVPTWSTEALAGEELSDPASSVLEIGDLPAIRNHASVTSKKPTTVPKVPTDISRRPTRQSTALSRHTTLEQPDVSSTSIDLPLERFVTKPSRQPTERAPSPSQSSESTLSFVYCPDAFVEETRTPTISNRPGAPNR